MDDEDQMDDEEDIVGNAPKTCTSKGIYNREVSPPEVINNRLYSIYSNLLGNESFIGYLKGQINYISYVPSSTTLYTKDPCADGKCDYPDFEYWKVDRFLSTEFGEDIIKTIATFKNEKELRGYDIINEPYDNMVKNAINDFLNQQGNPKRVFDKWKEDYGECPYITTNFPTE